MRIRTLIISMLAVFAVSAVASASASAECLKVAVAGTGAYSNNICTVTTGAKEYVEVEKLETELKAGEWCAKVKATEPSTYKNNTCTEPEVSTGKYIKVLVHEDQGPWYKIEGKTTAFERLEAGETASIAASTSEETTEPWKLVAGTKVVTCKSIALSSAELEGSTGQNSGKSKETVKFDECSVTGNGEPCEVAESKTITTEPLINELGYAKKTAGGEGEGKILTIFKPASGTKFAKINFEGPGCKVTSTIVETKAGCEPACEGVIAEDQTEEDKSIEVDAEAPVAAINDITFPATEITGIWTEAGGVLKGRNGGIAAFGVKAQQIGSADIALSGTLAGKKWGVFSSEKGDGK